MLGGLFSAHTRKEGWEAEVAKAALTGGGGILEGISVASFFGDFLEIIKRILQPFK